MCQRLQAVCCVGKVCQGLIAVCCVGKVCQGLKAVKVYVVVARCVRDLR